MKSNKLLSLLLSIILIVCTVLPTVALNAVETVPDSTAHENNDSDKINSILNAWSQVRYKADNAFIPGKVGDNTDIKLQPNTGNDIEYFGEKSFVANSTSLPVKSWLKLNDPDDTAKNESFNSFSKYPLNDINDVYLYIKANQKITVDFRYRINYVGNGSTQYKSISITKTVEPNKLTKLSIVDEKNNTFKSIIYNTYVYETGGNANDLDKGFVVPQFIDVRISITSSVDDNYSVTVGSAVIEGNATIPEKITAETNLNNVLTAAQRVLDDPYYINKERLQSIVETLEVNMAEHAPVSAYLTDSSGNKSELGDGLFSHDKQLMLTDNDTANPVSFSTQGKTLDILINHKSLIKLRKIKAYFSDSNVSQMKIYASKLYDDIWKEESCVYEYNRASEDSTNIIGIKLPEAPEFQYVRFSIIGTQTVNLTEIECISLYNEQLVYCNLIENNPETLTLAEIDKSSNKIDIRNSTDNKFGNSISVFKDNVYTICDGDTDTVFDFLGSPSTTSDVPTYNFIFTLSTPANVDNIKFVSGSNFEYFPTSVNFYVGDDFDSIISTDAQPIKSFNEAPADGVFNAVFEPTNISFVRIEILKNSDIIKDYYGGQLLTVVSEIEINGTVAVPVTAVNTEGELIGNGDSTPYDIYLTADGVKSVTDKVDDGTPTTLKVNSNGNYVITGLGKHVVTVELNDGNLIVLTYHIVKVKTEEFNNSDKFSSDNNLSLNITPHIFITKPSGSTKVRKHLGISTSFSDGDTINKTDFALGYQFRNIGEDGTYSGSYVNGYVPNVDFTWSGDNIVAYADIVYDLGRIAEIDKVQHFGPDNVYSMGLYQVYASDDMSNLFNENSLVLSYQNKAPENETFYGSQEHSFAKRSARFVAFRVFCPVTSAIATEDYLFNRLRIYELAIYGTENETDNYIISEVFAPDTPVAVATPEAEGTESLLNADNLTSVKYYDNKALVATKSGADYPKLHNGYYGTNDGIYDGTHNEIFPNYDFYNNGFKNGYYTKRGDITGNINLNHGDVTTWVDLTYELGDDYIIKQFDLYAYSGDNGYDNPYRIQDYEVYISDTENNLYNPESKVAECKNYLNTYGQKIKFDDTATNVCGRYLGVRILLPAYATKYNYTRLSEIAAFGTKAVASSFNAPNSMDLLTQGIYYTEADNAQKTAIYLFAEYKTPMETGTNSADPTKIVLDDGTIANVKSRTIYVASKTVYDKLANKDDFGKQNVSGVKSVTIEDREKLAKYWKRSAKDANGYVLTSYGVKIAGIKSETRNNAFAVRAKIVYTVRNKDYTVYSNIQTADNFSAQGAYDILKTNGKQPSNWFNTGYDDGSADSDNFFG